MFRQFDLFGKPVIFNFNGKAKSKSAIGSWFSLLFVGFIAWAIYEVGQDMVLRQDPKTITSESFSENPTYMIISPETFNFGFGLQHPITYSHYMNESIYTVDASLFTQRRMIHANGTVEVVQEDIPLALETCRKDHFGPLGPKFETIELDQLYCLKKDQPNLREIRLEGVFESPYFADISVQIKRCSLEKAGTSCAPKELIDQMLGGWFAVYFTNLAIEPKNYDSPTIGYRDSYYTSMSSTNFKEVTLWLSHVEVASDVGWLLKEEKVNNYIKLDYPREYSSFRPNTTKSMDFIVRVGKIRTRYERSYIKVQDILAKTNGFMTAGILAALIFIAPYSNIKFYERLINELFEIKTLQKSRKKNKKRRSDAKIMRPPAINTGIKASDIIKQQTKISVEEKTNNLFSPSERQSFVESSIIKTNKDPEHQAMDISQLSPGLSLTARATIYKKSDSLGTRCEKGEIDIEAKTSHLYNDKMDHNESIQHPNLVEEKEHCPEKDASDLSLSSVQNRFRAPKPQLLQNKPLMTPRPQIKVLEHFEPQGPGESLTTFEHLLMENQDMVRPKQSYDEHPFIKTNKSVKGLSNFHLKESCAKKENYSTGQEEIDEELINQKAEKLPIHLNKDSEKIQISFREYMCSWFWKSKAFKQKFGLLKEGIRRIDERLDIFNVLKKFREIDKLKLLLLENEQFILFDTLPNPELSVKGQKNGIKRSTSFSHNQLKEIKFINEKRRSDLISISYRNLKKRPRKTMIDERLLEIYDNIIDS